MSLRRTLLTLALLLGLAPAARAQTGSGGGTAGGGAVARCRTCDSSRTMAVARYAPEIARLRTQIALLRGAMIALATRPSREADSALAVLEPQLRDAALRLDQLQADMAFDVQRNVVDARDIRPLVILADSLGARVRLRLGDPKGAPVGYMGVALSGRSRDSDPWTKQYLEYPTVQAVDAGSPAAMAGMRSGDTIVAYDGVDVRKRAVDLRELLRPGATVRVKVRRAGRTKELPVQIARRQQTRIMVLGEDGQPIEAEVMRMPATTGSAHVRAPAPPRAGSAPPSPPEPRSFIWFGGQNDVVAGAELARVTPELGEPFGVETGLLVLNVAANTPAAQAGLRGGDVIVKVDGQEVVQPIALRKAINASDDDTVQLEVVRKKKRMTVRLAW